jgi:hypothetical protein
MNVLGLMKQMFPKTQSLHFLSKRQKFPLAKKKETTKKKKKKRLNCAAGSDDGVHHPDIINFFITSSLRSL